MKSDVLSFLTKPIVAISLSAGLLIVGLSIPAAGIALFAARLFFSAIGGGMLGFSVQNSFNGFLSQLLQAYSDQSQRAGEYIRTLEATDHEMNFVFA